MSEQASPLPCLQGIWRPGIRDYLLARLQLGPATIDDLMAVAWPGNQHQNEPLPANPRSVISTVLHNASKRGAPLARRLRDKAYMLVGPLPDDLQAGVAKAQERAARGIGRGVSNDCGVSRETNVSRETDAAALILRVRRG